MDAPLSVLLRDGTHLGANIRLALKVEQVAMSAARSVIQVALKGDDPIVMDMGMVRPSITISGIIDNVGGDLTNTGSANNSKGTWHMEKFVVGGQTYYIPYKNYLERLLTTSVTNDGYVMQIEVGDARVHEAYQASLIPDDYTVVTETDGPGLNLATVLAVEIDDDATTSITVDDTSNFYARQHILINSEVMSITAIVSSTVLTVVRGAKTSDVDDHDEDVNVYGIGASPSSADTGGGIYEVGVQQYQFSLAPGMEDRWIYSIQFVSRFRKGIIFENPE